MIELQTLVPVNYPDIPDSEVSNETAREGIVKSSAYITFALEEAGISHNRDLNAALVTDVTYTLAEDCSPAEYIELAVQELAYAESEVMDSEFQSELAALRKRLQETL